tara:strand:+ start:209 stop:709 length:501 start_codon:yes stop_codon:yes gene_type:complete
MFKIINQKNFTNLVLIIFIFLIDRISKILIVSYIKESGNAEIALTTFLNLNLIWNEGIAFGLLSFEDALSYNLVTIIISIVIIILLIMLNKAEKLSRFAILLVIGGALGNFFDRIYYSAVPDFIDFHLKSFHWFIFNVADIFISIGIICLIYVEILKKDKIDDKKI